MPNETIARNPSADPTLYTLQAGRGIAAIAVLFHHAANAVMTQNGVLPFWVKEFSSHGYLGVDFFFVLSGFIIYYVNVDRVGQERFASRYIVSRVTRVYVPYLPIGIAVALGYVFFSQYASSVRSWDWFSTLTLLPSASHPALGPAWTLQHEIAFYFFALLALLSGRFWWFAVAGAIAVIALDRFFDGSFKSLGLVDLEFLFGAIAAWCFMRDKVRLNWILILTGIAVCAGFLILGHRSISVVFGLGLALVLLPVVRLEKLGKIHIGPVLKLLGDASYAIYLIHYPMMSVLARVLSSLPSMATYCIIVVLSVIAGVLFHKLFEKPAISITKGFLDRRVKPSART